MEKQNKKEKFSIKSETDNEIKKSQGLGKRLSISIPKKSLPMPTQGELNDCEIRISDCTILYKLKHIETQAIKSRRRKVAKSLGFSFPSLRTTYSYDEHKDEFLFTNCIFNPSDKSILQEHIKNLETPRIRFINCKFLRRKKGLVQEQVEQFWRWQSGILVKFMQSNDKGLVDINSQKLWLKDFPATLEFIIENLK